VTYPIKCCRLAETRLDNFYQRVSMPGGRPTCHMPSFGNRPTIGSWHRHHIRQPEQFYLERIGLRWDQLAIASVMRDRSFRRWCT